MTFLEIDDAIGPIKRFNPPMQLECTLQDLLSLMFEEMSPERSELLSSSLRRLIWLHFASGDRRDGRFFMRLTARVKEEAGDDERIIGLQLSVRKVGC